MLRCPACHIPIAEFNSSGYSHAVCSQCTNHFGAFTGKVQQKSSRQITLQRQTKNHSGEYTREYEFRILLNSTNLKTIEFNINGKEDRVKAKKGDLITIIFRLENERIHEYISLLNHTTGTSFNLSTLRNKPQSSPEASGFTAAAISAAFLLFFKSGPYAAGVLSISIGVVTYLAVKLYRKSKVPVKKEVDPKVSDMQKLLLQKSELIEGRQDLFRRITNQTNALNYLGSTQQKMLSIDPNLYALRLNNIQIAIQSLYTLNQAEQSLIEKYNKVISMLEIEIESLNPNNQVTTEARTTIQTYIEDIKYIEFMNQELKLQLKANDEVGTLI